MLIKCKGIIFNFGKKKLIKKFSIGTRQKIEKPCLLMGKVKPTGLQPYRYNFCPR